jgi:hypothetical protein
MRPRGWRISEKQYYGTGVYADLLPGHIVLAQHLGCIHTSIDVVRIIGVPFEEISVAPANEVKLEITSTRKGSR